MFFYADVNVFQKRFTSAQIFMSNKTFGRFHYTISTPPSDLCTNP